MVLCVSKPQYQLRYSRSNSSQKTIPRKAQAQPIRVSGNNGQTLFPAGIKSVVAWAQLAMFKTISIFTLEQISEFASLIPLNLQ